MAEAAQKLLGTVGEHQRMPVTQPGQLLYHILAAQYSFRGSCFWARDVDGDDSMDNACSLDKWVVLAMPEIFT
jgi:hypothetical protein